MSHVLCPVPCARLSVHFARIGIQSVLVLKIQFNVEIITSLVFVFNARRGLPHCHVMFHTHTLSLSP